MLDRVIWAFHISEKPLIDHIQLQKKMRLALPYRDDRLCFEFEKDSPDPEAFAYYTLYVGPAEYKFDFYLRENSALLLIKTPEYQNPDYAVRRQGYLDLLVLSQLLLEHFKVSLLSWPAMKLSLSPDQWMQKLSKILTPYGSVSCQKFIESDFWRYEAREKEKGLEVQLYGLEALTQKTGEAFLFNSPHLSQILCLSSGVFAEALVSEMLNGRYENVDGKNGFFGDDRFDILETEREGCKKYYVTIGKTVQELRASRRSGILADFGQEYHLTHMMMSLRHGDNRIEGVRLLQEILSKQPELQKVVSFSQDQSHMCHFDLWGARITLRLCSWESVSDLQQVNFYELSGPAPEFLELFVASPPEVFGDRLKILPFLLFLGAVLEKQLDVSACYLSYLDKYLTAKEWRCCSKKLEGAPEIKASNMWSFFTKEACITTQQATPNMQCQTVGLAAVLGRELELTFPFYLEDQIGFILQKIFEEILLSAERIEDTAYLDFGAFIGKGSLVRCRSQYNRKPIYHILLDYKQDPVYVSEKGLLKRVRRLFGAS